MPDRDYVLNYVVNGNQAVSVLRAIKTELALVDGQTKGVTSSLRDMHTEMALAGAKAQGLGDALGNAGGGFRILGDNARGLLPAWQVFEVGVNLAQNFGQMINNARDHLRELAKDAAETRDRMRELANLKGETGPNDAVVAETIVMGMNAGMLPDEARKFMEQFEGSIPAGREKGNIAKGLEAPLAQEAMKFGTRVKLNPETAGDLAGILPQYSKIESVEQGAGKMGAIVDALNAGRGNVEPLTKSLIKTAGEVVEEQGGPVGSLEELAAMLGVASTGAKPDAAGTSLKNAIRGLRHFKDDDQGRTLQELGITPQMKTREALARIAPKIREADAQGTGGDVWLRTHGFNQDREVVGLLQLARNEGVVQKRIDDALRKNQGQAVMQADEDYLRREWNGIHRRNEAEKAGQDWLTGAKNEPLEEARKAGAAQMRSEGKSGGFWNGARQFAWDAGGALPWIGVKSEAQDEAERTFLGMLFDEGQRVGIDMTDELYNVRGESMEFYKNFDTPERRNYFTKSMQSAFDADDGKFVPSMIKKVIDAGGDPYRGSKPETVKKLQAQIQAERDGQRDEVVGSVVAAGTRVGVDVPAQARAAAGPRAPGWTPTNEDMAGLNKGDFLTGMVDQIRRKGGDPFGGSKTLEQKFDRLIEETKRTNDLLGNGPAQPGAAGAVPGRK